MPQNLPKPYRSKLFQIAAGLFLLSLLILLSVAIRERPSAENNIAVQKAAENFKTNKLAAVFTRGLSLKGGTAGIKKTVHPIVSPDTSALRKSDWFSLVKKDIENRFYYIGAGKEPNSYSGSNYQQGLLAGFTARSFTLSPLAQAADVAKPDEGTKGQTQPAHSAHGSADDWKLTLQFSGLYADGNLTDAGEGMAVVKEDKNDIEYGYGDRFAIQYHNDNSGVRQNFLVKQAPVANTHHLTVAFQAKGDWVVNKVHDHELQFARRSAHGGLDRKIIYKDLKAWDANGAPLLAKMESGRDGKFSIEVNTENAVYPVTIDPLSTTANNTYRGAAYNFLGCSVASAGDVNGDGYSDVIVGASGIDINIAPGLGMPTTIGQAFIYLGSATGLSSTPTPTPLTDNIAGDKFGVSVASAGDVNGDGFSDVIVGADLYAGGGTKQGIAYVYLGGDPTNGVSTTPVASLIGTSADGSFLGFSVASAGDVNGDGFSDVIVGAFGYSFGGQNGGEAYIYEGTSTGVNTTIATTLTSPTGVTGDSFGFSVASAGDMNGDGFADVIVGAWGTNSGTGAAYVYEGSSGGVPNTVAFSQNGVNSGDSYGNSVAGAGDVNGDGFADVIVGAPGVASTGAAYLYLGAAGTPTSGGSVTTSIGASDKFGCSVASAGDVNGDGFADVIVGAYGVPSDLGYAYVFYGSAAGIVNTDSTVLTTNNNTDQFGYSVASAGDVNGDGYSDIIIGGLNAPNGAATDAGAAYVYQGGPQGVSSTIASGNTFTVGSTGFFGFNLASAGDLNSDGYNDVVVGAYNTGGSNIGAAYVYMGSANGLPPSPSVILGSGATSNNYFGISAAAAGDVNGDGYGDLLIGAFGVGGAGAAYLYYGSSAGISNTPSLTLTEPSPGLGHLFGASVAGVGDVNADGYKDIAIGAPNPVGIGAIYYYAGKSGGILATPTAIITGPSVAGYGFVAGAGDVNGDGYSDFVTAAPAAGSTGTLYVFHGSATGPVSGTAAATASETITGPSGSSNFGGSATTGSALSTAGDTNGDGFDDIIVGASGTSSNKGAAYIYTGSSSGLNPSPTVLTGLGTASGALGTSVSGLGDVNGDGYSDVIVGAPATGTGTAGAAFVYIGGPGGITNTVATTLSGVASNDRFGSGVAGAGDVNGDGFSDAIVGAAGVSSSAGAAYLFEGNNALGHGGNNVLRLYESDFSGPIKQDNVDLTTFGLGLFVKPPYARAKARLVWEVEGNGTPFKSGASSTIGTSVFSSGQTAYTTNANPIPSAGMELRATIAKVPSVLATKVRVRVEYAPTAFSASQTYGPWIYTQALSTGTSTGVVLPLTWISFTATVVGGQDVLLNWKTENEVNTQSFVVEHSTDATGFTDIGTVPAQDINTGVSAYSYTHTHPGAGTHYYRLRQVNIDGSFTYSKVVTAIIDPTPPVFSVYPNPATDHLTVVYTNSNLSMDMLRFINVSGAVVKEVQINTGNASTNVPLTGLSKGVYFIQLASGSIAPKQIVIQ